MPVFRRAASIAAATSVVLLGSVSAATAQPAALPHTVTLHDAWHDVWAGSSVVDPASEAPAPRQTAGDVRWARLRYGPKNVVLTEKYAELARWGRGDLYDVRLRTNTGLRRVVEVRAFRGSWRGSIAMYRMGGGPVACDGAAEQIDYARDLLRISVPVDCLRDPRSVQVNAMNGHITRHDDWLLDNPHNTKASFNGWSPRVWGR